MNVTGCDNGLSKLVAERNYLAVKLAQTLLVGDNLLSYKKRVVADRLYLEVVIKRGDILDFLLALFVENCAEKLARFAGAADNKPLPVLFERGKRNTRLFVEILKV